MIIHTFGDSHSSKEISGWKDCNNIEAHHLGAVLCYSFGKEKLGRCNINNYNINDNDTIIFCFGEIDCRCHIHKHISSDKSYQVIIDEIINDYIEAIQMNVDNCDKKLRHVCIYNVVPTVQKGTTPESDIFPFLGSDEERKNYVLYFNHVIKMKCQEKNWIYFDVYDSYTDGNGFLNPDYSDGNVHIRNGIFINQFINKYLL